MKKLFKHLGITILGILGLSILGTILFLNISPQFGKDPSTEQQVGYMKSGHFVNGIFVNEMITEMDIQPSRLLKKMFEDAPNRNPGRNIEVGKIDSLEITALGRTFTRITWFGHSAFLLELDGKKILLDPMLGESPYQ